MRSVLLLLLFAAPVFAQQAAPPPTLEINGAFLARMKAHPTPAILDAVRSEADQALHAGPFSVMDKKETPPSGSKHDYMSLATYWWPNPATKNGLPYIRHDGETNPQTRDFPDHREINELIVAVHSLGLGYYFTGNEAYASHAVLLLRAWFLDPATRMNPNLNYAQAVLGVNTGRGTGLIDDHQMPLLLDGLTLLSRSPELTPQDKAGLRNWFTVYLQWLQTSRNGHDESDAKNNHGSWFDQQIVGIALYLGDRELARKICETAKTRRIALQIEPDGSEPLELARTKSFSYSAFNLDALCRLAEEAQRAGVDLWGYKSPDGGSIRAALDFLLPYAQGTKKWTHKAINGVDPNELTEPLLLAALHYRDAAYLAGAEKFDKRPNAGTLLLQQEVKLELAGH
jgi:Alginate lyase